MKRTHYLIGAALAPALIAMTGCNEINESSVSQAQPGLSATEVNPCTVALTQHQGTEAIDRTILQLQEKLHQQDKPLALLERLGWAFVTKARTSFDEGYYQLAEQTALCMTVKQADSLAAKLLQGHVMHNQHRFRDAGRVARELVAQRGLWFDYALLGDALMEQGQLDKAVVAYQQMLDQKPGPVAYMRSAHMRWLSGDLSGAIELMQMARRGVGRNLEISGWINTRLALYEMQAGNLSQASQYLQHTLQQQPDYAPALLTQGRLLLARNDYRAALVPLTRATELNPLPEYQWLLLEALQAAGEHDQARQIALQLDERGAADDPRTYALYLTTTGGNTGRALNLLREEYKNRADMFTLDAYAWALLAQGQIEDAYEFIVRALAHNTVDARLFLHAGLIAKARGNSAEAEQWLTKAGALQQMLLPSEQALLAKEFAGSQPQISSLLSNPLSGQ